MSVHSPAIVGGDDLQSGTDEALVPDVCDACLDLVETGGTALSNGDPYTMTFKGAHFTGLVSGLAGGGD